MVNYKKTGKYVQTPIQNPTDIYVGKPEEVDYSGKSTRIDDNFTYIANQIGGPEKYHAGEGLILYASASPTTPDSEPELDTFCVDTDYVNSLITASIAGKQDKLIAGDNIDIDSETNTISIYGIVQYSEATSETAGLMSAEDKDKLDTIARDANNYVLTPATRERLGGVIVGDHLTITDGVLSADYTEYVVAIPPGNGSDGTAGLMSANDKAKLDSITLGATRVTASNTNGYVIVDNTGVEVYRHPRYNEISGVIDSGTLINGITVDDTGHVLGYSTTNEAGINVVKSGVGNVIVDANYNSTSRTLTLSQSYIGDRQIGSLDSDAVGTIPATSDRLNTVLQKIRNNIALVNSNLSSDIASISSDVYGKLEYKGTVSALPNNAENGDVYKATSTFALGQDTVVNGDLILYSNSSWVKVPSGEWRPIYVGDTQRLSADHSSGLLRFKGSGVTSVTWDSTDNSVVVYTPANSGGGGSGTGSTTYSAGEGLDRSDNPSDVNDKIFKLLKATTSSLGGVIVGNGISVDGDGKISAAVYTGSNGITVANNNISISRGTQYANQVPEGNHRHSLASLSDTSISELNENDYIKFDGENWTNAQLDPITYTSDDSNVIIDNETHKISVAGRNISVVGADPVQVDNWEPLIFAAGPGIRLEKIHDGDLANGYTSTIKITNTSDSTAGATAYTADYPIKLTVVDANTKSIGLNYDTNTLEVTNDNKLKVKSSVISDTNTWRSFGAIDENDNKIIDLGTGTNTNAIILKASTGISFTQSISSGVTTLTISGGSSDVDVLDDLSDVVISGTVPDGSVLKFNSSSGKWSPAVDDTSTVTYTSGDGIVVTATGTDNISTISTRLYEHGGLGYNTTSQGAKELKVNVDGSSISINQSTNQLYVSLSSALVEIDASHNTELYNNGAISFTMYNNTIYRLGGNITSISFSNDSAMSYCTLCFTTPSSITSGFWNTAWRCVGNDCLGGTFTPSADSEYQIAIDNLSGRYTCYVLKLSTTNN